MYFHLSFGTFNGFILYAFLLALRLRVCYLCLFSIYAHICVILAVRRKFLLLFATIFYAFLMELLISGERVVSVRRGMHQIPLYTGFMGIVSLFYK